jgi:NAD(P)-dependent dehydrogenase (short-subunit alcohol dehydrogenase family)
MQLDQRVSVVTGAGDGIGKAAAIAFARAGSKVVVNDVSAESAQATVDEIIAGGGIATTAVVGVGTPEAAGIIVDTALDAYGSLHILVNNAAVGGDSPVESITDEQIERSLRINLAGPIYLVREAVNRIMIPARDGRIINLTSRSGLRGKFGESVYAAGKAGLVGASLAWSLELIPHGITVNCVAPAAWTRLLEIMPEPERSNTIKKRENNVLGRVAMPEDVAPTLVFLASADAAYITGQVIEATGQPASLL